MLLFDKNKTPKLQCKYTYEQIEQLENKAFAMLCLRVKAEELSHKLNK